jgi:hypothetical protein
LLGVSVSQLEDASVRQLSLDDAERGGWSAASTAIDSIRERFGDSSIVPATMTGRGAKRRGEQQWGPEK